MAMSDTCFEVLGDLSSGVTHYSYLKYDAADLSLIVDSMYSLARFGILQDNIDRPAEDWIVKASNRIVIGHLIEDMDAEAQDAACKCIAGIAMHNVRLGQGIDALVKSAEHKNALFDAIAEPVMHSRLQKIAAYKAAI
jgi:hypothetical protein